MCHYFRAKPLPYLRLPPPTTASSLEAAPPHLEHPAGRTLGLVIACQSLLVVVFEVVSEVDVLDERQRALRDGVRERLAALARDSVGLEPELLIRKGCSGGLDSGAQQRVGCSGDTMVRRSNVRLWRREGRREGRREISDDADVR